jgi:hypothetical protein
MYCGLEFFQDFFDQVGHKTTLNLVKISIFYQNWEQSQQELGTIIENKVKLNEYETAPYFFQLIQNLISNCLLISVLPVFA